MEELPFYERGLFWGLASLALALVLAAAGFLLSPTTFAKWLLILAWLLSVTPLWLAWNTLADKAATYFLIIMCWALFAVGLDSIWNFRVKAQSPDATKNLPLPIVIPAGSLNGTPLTAKGILPPTPFIPVIVAPPSLPKPKQTTEKDAKNAAAMTVKRFADDVGRLADDVQSKQDQIPEDDAGAPQNKTNPSFVQRNVLKTQTEARFRTGRYAQRCYQIMDMLKQFTDDQRLTGSGGDVNALQYSCNGAAQTALTLNDLVNALNKTFVDLSTQPVPPAAQ